MMNKIKVCAKMHLFIIISAIVIAIGMAVGTICHFCAGGFFNYGGEFNSYKCITVNYTVEYKDTDELKPVCENALGKLNAYEVSYADTTYGGEIVYKFTSNTDTVKLQEAVDKINTEAGLNIASVHEGTVREGGSKAITFASIALASAAVFQFLYFILRYKLRAAYSALLACVHNLGVFVALAAITRIPVGAEFITFGAAVVVFTMILCGVLFDRTKKNFANEKNAKTERLEVLETSAAEVRMLTLISGCALAIASVVFGVFAAIAQLWAGALAPFAVVILGLAACLYGAMFFTPAVHGAIDGVCEKVKAALKDSKKEKKSKKSEKTEKAKV
ncbi:MAG: hypothetical protein K2N14_03845 [Clostridia bacterium]|nr:hypothetical protein [Clostridia bacterium]